jgi:probable F420-dependent oxidoreductase
MTPFFSPPPHEWGPPPVFLAGGGKLMTEVAGEVCDGFFFHAFTTPSYLREVTIPALERGRLAAGAGSLEGFTVAGPAFTCVGRNDEELELAIRGTKEQIAFYASTPAYRGVLEHHGWGDLQPELTRMSKEGKWTEMADVIDDDVVRTFAAVGDVKTVARQLRERWDVATRLSFYIPYRADDAVRRELLAELS